MMYRLCRVLVLTILASLGASQVWAAAPTLGSQDFLRASSTGTNLTLANVDSGAGILVIVMQNAQNVRTYTVVDATNGTFYTELTDATNSTTCNGGGTQRCVRFFFLPSSLSTASMTITITQSSTSQAYAVAAVEINCPNTCAYDSGTGSFFTNTAAITHFASTSGINSSVNAFIVSACTGNQSGAETKKPSFTAMLTEGVNDGPSMAQYLTTTSAVTSERGEISSGVSGATECSIVSIKDTIASSGTSAFQSLLGVGK